MEEKHNKAVFVSHFMNPPCSIIDWPLENNSNQKAWHIGGAHKCLKNSIYESMIYTSWLTETHWKIGLGERKID